MSLHVRLPGCSAMATIGGTNETYIAVPGAHERSAPSAAPMIATPWGMRESTARATAYRSPVFSGIRARLAGMVKWSDNSAVAPGAATSPTGSSSNPTATPEPIKIRAAYGNVTPANLAPFYAKEKGIFLQNGLDVDLSLIDGGGKSMAALLGNSVEIAQLGGTEAMSAYVGGGDVQAVALFVPVSPWVLMAPASSTGPND